jgi:hypothetical protein
MKTDGFRTFRVLPPWSVCERQNPKKLEEVAFGHFFDSKRTASAVLLLLSVIRPYF